MIRAQSVAYLTKNQKLRPKATHPLGEPEGKLKINENWINRQLFHPTVHALLWCWPSDSEFQLLLHNIAFIFVLRLDYVWLR